MTVSSSNFSTNRCIPERFRPVILPNRRGQRQFGPFRALCTPQRQLLHAGRKSLNISASDWAPFARSGAVMNGLLPLPPVQLPLTTFRSKRPAGHKAFLPPCLSPETANEPSLAND
jgi:hypothetical protein